MSIKIPLSVPEPENAQTHTKKDAAGDPVASIMKHLFEEDKKANPMSEEAKARLSQAIKDLPTARMFSTSIHDHNLMQTQVSDAQSATEFMRVANSTRHDAIMVSAPGCVMLQGNSRAMQETMAKFGLQRQDVVLSDNRAVATYWPSQSQTASGFAANMLQFYQQRAAIEHCQQIGVDSIDTHGHIAVAMGGVSMEKAAHVTETLGSEFKNAATVCREGTYFKAVVQLDSAVVDKLDEMGYGVMSASSASDKTTTFRFDNMQEAQQFLKDAETLTAQREAQLATQQENSVQVLPQSGITIIKAHNLSLPEVTAAVETIGAAHHNSVFLKSMDGTPDKMQLMVDSRSPLGQALMKQYSDKMTGSSRPDVAAFYMESREDIMKFLNDANELGKGFSRDDMDIGDVPIE